MKSKHVVATLVALLLALVWLPTPKLSGQVVIDANELPSDKSPDVKSSDPVVLTISYGEGQEAHLESHSGTIGVISVRPDEMIPLSLHFPNDKIGLPVAVAPVDGGEVVGMASVSNLDVNANGQFTFDYEPKEALSVDSAGLIRFGFQPSHQPGFHRLLVQLPGEQHILQFYVMDSTSPTFRQ